MKTSVLSDTLLSKYQDKILRKKSPASWVSFFVVLSVAIASLIFLFSYNFGSDSELKFYVSFVMVAFFIIAVLQFLFGKKRYYYTPDNVVVNACEYYFNTTSDKLFDAIKKGDKDYLKSVSNSVDSGIKLEMAYTDNGSLSVCQSFKYIPYEYLPDSEVVDLSKKEVELLIGL